MNPPICLVGVMLCVMGGLPVAAETSLQAAIPLTRITGPVSDGAPSPPSPPPVLPEFVVKSSVVRRVAVVEAPPMAGLPAVRGTITETVQMVEDPHFPEPPPPLPPADPNDPRVQERLAEMRGMYRKRELLFVSATVYDHSRTLLRCYPNGNPGKVIAVWSNLDFNHFSGFGTFEVKGADGGVRSYGLMMGIGNVDTQKWAAVLASHGRKYVSPEIPALPDDEPAFVVLGANRDAAPEMQEAEPDADGIRLVEDLHELYRCEGARMKTAYLARIEAEKERRAFLLAHPPVPEDVTIRFWKRDVPAAGSRKFMKGGAR